MINCQMYRRKQYCFTLWLHGRPHSVAPASGTNSSTDTSQMRLRAVNLSTARFICYIVIVVVELNIYFRPPGFAFT
jgi:hypothetical protein